MLARRAAMRAAALRRSAAGIARMVSVTRGMAMAVAPRAVAPAMMRKAPMLQRVRGLATLPDHEVMGLPALSPTMESGTIALWNVKEGEAFSAGDALCEVETDKATVGFEATDDGVLAKILVEAGAGEITVGTPICVVVEEGTDVAPFSDFAADESAPALPEKEPEAPAAPAEKPKEAAPASSPPPASGGAPSSGDRVAISPYARKLAKDKGLDISQLKGTGPNGRIIAADVESASPQSAGASHASAPPAAGAPGVPGDGYVDFPTSPTAIQLAAKLTHAKQTVPHYFLTVDCNVTALLALRASLNAKVADGDTTITLNDFLVKAAALAMEVVPEVNAEWREEDGVVRSYERVDVNVFMNSALSGGTAAPVVLNAGEVGLSAISESLARAADSLAENGGVPGDLSGNGTFSIVNLGAFGIKAAAPIVNTPQAAIMAVGAVADRVVPSKATREGYAVAPVMTVTVSFDHRVVDGAVGAQWLAALKRLIEDPHAMLL